MRFLTLMLTILISGCSTSEVVRAPSAATEQPSSVAGAKIGVEEQSEQIFSSSLETQLILGLWVHLGKERDRLSKMLDTDLTTEEKHIVQRFIYQVEDEQRHAWQTMLTSE